MSASRDFLMQSIRLAILQCLDLDAGGSCNHVMIVHWLEDRRAYSLTDEEVKEQLAWLEALKLVVIEDVNHYRIARLTEDGVRAARGLKKVEGVARVDPRG